MSGRISLGPKGATYASGDSYTGQWSWVWQWWADHSDWAGTTTADPGVPASYPGIWFTRSTVGYYPAGGYRLDGSGAQVVVGTNGYSWSSTSHGSDFRLSHGLRFDATDVNPFGNHVRAAGFPVRCVQEFTIGFDRFVEYLCGRDC